MMIALRVESEKFSPLPSCRPARFSRVGAWGVCIGGVGSGSGCRTTGSQNVGGSEYRGGKSPRGGEEPNEPPIADG